MQNVEQVGGGPRSQVNKTRKSFLELVYFSAETQAFGPQELEELLAKARMTNRRLGVSGVLLYHLGSFLQVLEGEPQVVEELFHRIAGDPRHDRCRVLLRREVESRSFANWSMGYYRPQPTEQAPPGFVRFMEQHGEPDGRLAGDSVIKTLLAFKAGRWRASIQN